MWDRTISIFIYANSSLSLVYGLALLSFIALAVSLIYNAALAANICSNVFKLEISSKLLNLALVESISSILEI